MLFGLILVLHVLVAVFLIAVILLQGGRGGMGETLSGAAAQSLFGGAANTVMTKITAIGAGLFMLTCLSLAALSTARGRSVIDQLRQTSGQLPFTLPQEHELPSRTVEPTKTETAAPPAPTPSHTTPAASVDTPVLTPAPQPSTPSGSDAPSHEHSTSSETAP